MDKLLIKILIDFKKSENVIERNLYLDFVKFMKEITYKFAKVGQFEELKNWLNDEIINYKVYYKL